MANFIPELQKGFVDVIKEIQVALDPIKSEPIIAKLKEIFGKLKSPPESDK